MFSFTDQTLLTLCLSSHLCGQKAGEREVCDRARNSTAPSYGLLSAPPPPLPPSVWFHSSLSRALWNVLSLMSGSFEAELVHCSCTDPRRHKVHLQHVQRCPLAAKHTLDLQLCPKHANPGCSSVFTRMSAVSRLCPKFMSSKCSYLSTGHYQALLQSLAFMSS